MGKILTYKPHMPEPTAGSPYAQVEWIFREKMLCYENKHTKGNYQAACSFYIKFLRETNNYNPDLKKDPRFFLAKEWDSAALIKLERWLQATNIGGSENYLTSYTITGNFSAVRQTMEYAFENSHIPAQVFKVLLPSGVPETEQRAAYTDDEYELIFKAIAPHIRFSKGLLIPYRPKGIGRDPRILNSKGMARGEKLIGQGWSCWQPSADGSGLLQCDDNMLWYFENEMQCRPLAGTPEHEKKHLGFFLQATNRFGGLNKLYKKWGVSAFIDKDAVLPLLVELVAESGLNVESVLSLRRNCFVKAHPLTGLPFLQYCKLRSGGEKELPLSLYDQSSEAKSVKLGQKQSQIIARTIDAILKLTEPLVPQASEEDKEYLFLYQIRGKKSFGEVERVTKKTLCQWTKKILSENDLRDRRGKSLIFNLSRFRPTKFTKMVKEGHDIFHIMAVAGHSSVTTTLGYIDRLGTTGDFHEVVQKALIKIKNNKHQQERRQLPIAKQENADPGKFVFKGSFCNCKNPYDPPEQVKKSRSYHSGDACTNWNMCLSCDNVLITEHNVPKLWAYRAEIHRVLANGADDMPRQGELYKRTAAILDQILAPDELFSKEVLDTAARIAGNQEYEFLDAFVY